MQMFEWMVSSSIENKRKDSIINYNPTTCDRVRAQRPTSDSFRSNQQNQQLSDFKSSESFTKHPSITTLYSSGGVPESPRSHSADKHVAKPGYLRNKGFTRYLLSPEPEPRFCRKSLKFSALRSTRRGHSIEKISQSNLLTSLGNNENRSKIVDDSEFERDIHIKVDRQLAPWEYSIFKYNPLHDDDDDDDDSSNLSEKLLSKISNNLVKSSRIRNKKRQESRQKSNAQEAAEVFGNNKLINLLHERISIKSSRYDISTGHQNLAKNEIKHDSCARRGSFARVNRISDENVEKRSMFDHTRNNNNNNNNNNKKKKKRNNKNYHYYYWNYSKINNNKLKNQRQFRRELPNQTYYYVKPKQKRNDLKSSSSSGKYGKEETKSSKLIDHNRWNPLLDIKRRFFSMPSSNRHNAIIRRCRGRRRRRRRRRGRDVRNKDEIKFIETVIERVATTRRIRKKLPPASRCIRDRSRLLIENNIQNNKKSHSSNDLLDYGCKSKFETNKSIIPNNTRSRSHEMTTTGCFATSAVMMPYYTQRSHVSKLPVQSLNYYHNNRIPTASAPIYNEARAARIFRKHERMRGGKDKKVRMLDSKKKLLDMIKRCSCSNIFSVEASTTGNENPEYYLMMINKKYTKKKPLLMTNNNNNNNKNNNCRSRRRWLDKKSLGRKRHKRGGGSLHEEANSEPNLIRVSSRKEGHNIIMSSSSSSSTSSGLSSRSEFWNERCGEETTKRRLSIKKSRRTSPINYDFTTVTSVLCHNKANRVKPFMILNSSGDRSNSFNNERVENKPNSSLVDNNKQEDIIDPFLNKYASLSDLSIDDYSASKAALSNDSELDREYAMVNRPSPDHHHHRFSNETLRSHELEPVVAIEKKSPVSSQATTTRRSFCTSLFESDDEKATMTETTTAKANSNNNNNQMRRFFDNRLSKSFSITYKSGGDQKRLSLYQLLGNCSWYSFPAD